jgi:hypothetical protein
VTPALKNGILKFIVLRSVARMMARARNESHSLEKFATH